MDEKYRVLNRDAIKYIAIVTMVLNHISTIFMKTGTVLGEIFLDIGYFTAVTMCYFLVEGFQYTHSKKKYGIRLGIFALVSELPYCLAFTEKGVMGFCGMNMLFTLFLCFLILLAKEKIGDPFGKNLIIAGLLFLSCFSDWAVLAPVFTLLFSWAKGSKDRLKTAFTAAAVIFGVMNFAGGAGRFPVSVNLLYALGSIVGIIASGFVIIRLYNGKRMEKGRNFSKWFFYWFYPAHLLILGVMRICLH